MQETWTIDFIWWITVVELPALAGLFWLNWRNRRDADTAVDDTRHQFETGHMMLRESLAAYKLEVAKTYVSIDHLKDVESRITHHLFRIENKLDTTGRSAQGGIP